MSSPGFRPEGLTQADCDRLHFLKNRPPVPEVNGEPLTFPPYEYRAFPCAMYHASDPTSPRLVLDAQEKQNFLSRGWRDTPDEAKSFATQAEADRMTDAAVRAYDDRAMSPAAQAEVAALEKQTNDVVSEVPAPKKRGRPANTTPAATAA